MDAVEFAQIRQIFADMPVLVPIQQDPFSELLLSAYDTAKRVMHSPRNKREGELRLAAALLLLMQEREGYVAIVDRMRAIETHNREYMSNIEAELTPEARARIRGYSELRDKDRKQSTR